MDMAFCSHCNTAHPVPPIGTQNKYWRWQRNKSLKNGGYFVCQKWYKSYQLNYKRTKDGWIRITYLTQRKSSKARKHPMPSYTFEEFKQWAFSQSEFDTLFDGWMSNNYIQDLRPSVDRISDDKPYTLDNIQLMTFKENRLAGVRGSKAHKAYDRVNSLQGLKVYQYTLDNKLIASYKSSHVASKITGVDSSSINKCCNGKLKTAGGFKWCH
jgi:hypothetical protein